jgi:hypothetical protein
MKINRDSYYNIHTKWKGGFEHTNSVRGYNLSSMLKFNASLFWIESTSYEEITQEQYEERMYGPIDEGTEKQADSTKRKPRAKRSEDSKAVRNPSGQSPRTTKEKSSVLRESKVRDVRKPKKDVQGTNNPRKTTPARTRSSEGQTKQRTGRGK